MSPNIATEQQLQSVIQLGYACPERIAQLPKKAVLTRVWWIFFHPESESEQWLDLDAWIDYAETYFPGVDPEQLDMALGCC